MILLAVLAVTIIAAVAISTVVLIRRTSINVVIRKDPDMSTIKQRLAALEASTASLATAVATISDQVVSHGAALDAAATGDQLAGLTSQVAKLATTVAGISDEIGTDPVADIAPADLAPEPKDAAPATADPAAPAAPVADPTGLA